MATRIYVKLGDLEGPIVDTNHDKWNEAISVQTGCNNNMNCVEKVQGNPGGEAHHHHDLTMTKVIDSTSPQFAVHTALGSGFDKCEIEVWEEGEKLYKILLEKVAIASYSIEANQQGVPHEKLTLNYALIQYSFRDGAEDHFNLASDASSLQKKAFSKSFQVG
jgi:type VI secretion system secreted protein Hcp